MASPWVLGAVGDVFLNRPDPLSALKPAATVLEAVDILFGNCEGAYTDAPHYAPSAGWRVVSGTMNARALGPAGFDVMSCANNHMVDAGHEGLFDTLDVLAGQGIRTVGAGRDLAEARRQVTLERQGQKISFLAYSSILQAGYAAHQGVPGVAAMRVHSHYYFPDWDPYGPGQPGAQPHVRTFPYPEDVAVMTDAVAATKEFSDLVVVSFHWGDASRPAFLHDYELSYGRGAIEAGADVVFGHHHHFLRGMEIYHGKPIFYGLGHFAFDLPDLEDALSPIELAKLREFGEYAVYPRDGYPLLPFHPDARMTMLAVCLMEGAEIVEAGFLPFLINSENQPMPVALSSVAAQEICSYVDAISREACLGKVFLKEGPTLGSYQSVVMRAG